MPTDSVDSRGVLMWMLLTSFFVHTSTMGQLCVSFSELADNAANLATMLFTSCLRCSLSKLINLLHIL